jgi:hypothetical protein
MVAVPNKIGEILRSKRMYPLKFPAKNAKVQKKVNILPKISTIPNPNLLCLKA